MAGALDDLRVIELGTGEAAALCGRFFAELGAEVLKIEPPAGDPLRRVPPYLGGTSYLFEMLAAGKRSISLDPDTPDGSSALHGLLLNADIVVETDGPRALAPLGLDYPSLRDRYPGLVYCSLSAFGRSGPFAERPGGDLIAQAMSGVMFINGSEEEPPTRCAPALADFAGAVHGVIGSLAALYFRDRTGLGQQVDVATRDVLAFMNCSTLAAYNSTGRLPKRQGNRHAAISPYNVYPASDGWVLICTANDSQWQRMAFAMGREDLAGEPRFAFVADRAARVEEVDANVRAWTESHTVAEAVAALRAADIPVGAVATVAGLLVDPQFVDRGMVASFDRPAGTVRVPGSFFSLLDTPGAVLCPAPALGECRPGDLAPHAVPSATPSRPALHDPDKGPLAGLKVLEVAHFVAGPSGPSILADLGADVVKIEQPGTGDGLRGFTPMQNGLSYTWAMINRGKRSLALSLRSETGRQVLRELAAQADVVLENFSVGVLDRLGVGYEELTKVNPELVFCSVCGFGQSGPNRDRPAFDQIIQANSGLMSIGGWPERPPHRAATAAVDYMGGFVNAASTLAALHYRHRTGLGQRLDICMNDVGGALTYSAWPAYLAEGKLLPRYGNSYPFAAPSNAYKAGDGMVVIGVERDEQWQGLRKAMGDPAPLAGYDSTSLRLAAAGLLDEVIAQWVERQAVAEVVALCLEHGVPAAPVLTVADLIDDAQITSRRMLVSISSASAGEFLLTGCPIALSLTPSGSRGPVATPGEDTEDVLASWLSYSPGQVARLRTEGVV